PPDRGRRPILPGASRVMRGGSSVEPLALDPVRALRELPSPSRARRAADGRQPARTYVRAGRVASRRRPVVRSHTTGAPAERCDGRLGRVFGPCQGPGTTHPSTDETWSWATSSGGPYPRRLDWGDKGDVSGDPSM